MGFGGERMAKKQLWPRGEETCKLSHCYYSYHLTLFKLFTHSLDKNGALDISMKKAFSRCKGGIIWKEGGRWSERRCNDKAKTGVDRGWEGHWVWRASENNAERKIILQRQRILEPFLLFSRAFRLGHLLARRKDGVIPTVVLVLSIDQVPGLEGVGSVWQCMESRWSQDTGYKPGFGRLSLYWFVRLQDWKM